MTEKNAGEILGSHTLYKQQKNTNKPDAPLIIAVDLRTPANIASIFRLADATAINKIIFVQETVRHFDLDKIIKRHSRNTSQQIESEYWTYEKFHSDYVKLPTLIALELTSMATDIFSTRLPASCSFVIGSERYGIPESILQKCSSAVKIPMFGKNGSMNVSHALAICLYEWHRQHTLVNTIT